MVSTGEGGGDHVGNLQGLCKPHHDYKTAQEAGTARAASKAQWASKGRHPRELSPLEKMLGERDL